MDSTILPICVDKNISGPNWGLDLIRLGEEGGMIEIRIHGRGGQGNVVAAYVLATAAIGQGLFAQAFPAFGAERRGAPVAAFVRIAETPIRRRCQVAQPAFVIIQDETLAVLPDTLAGLASGGGVMINSPRDSQALVDTFGRATYTLPATRLSLEALGRPMPNMALLVAFLTLTELLPIAGLKDALAQRFRGEVLADNLALVCQVADATPHGIWKELVHAASA